MRIFKGKLFSNTNAFLFTIDTVFISYMVSKEIISIIKLKEIDDMALSQFYIEIDFSDLSENFLRKIIIKLLAI